MFQTVEQFIELWKGEVERTLQYFEQLTDQSLSVDLVPDYRTLGRLAWHIAQTPREMLARTGLAVAGPSEEDPIPTTTAEIIAAYRTTTTSVQQEVASWTDLSQTDEMYGEEWPRSTTLLVLVHHQIHHRAQIGVLMRVAGLKAPGIYGPAREEWQNYGVPVPVV